MTQAILERASEPTADEAGLPVPARPVAEFAARFARHATSAHVLYRVAEWEALRQVRDVSRGRVAPVEPLVPPVVELGCGDGRFAAAALAEPVDVGVDCSRRRLRTARAAGGHRTLVRCDVARLPVADGAFQTALCISVLEHLPDPAEALAEARRVLRPGGTLVATIALVDLRGQLFYPALLERVGLRPLARVYRAAHDRAFGHRSLWTQGRWEEAVAAAGLVVEHSRKIVPPDVTRRWDARLPWAALEAAWRWLARRRSAGGPRGREIWTHADLPARRDDGMPPALTPGPSPAPAGGERGDQSSCAPRGEDAAADGSSLLVVARKP